MKKTDFENRISCYMAEECGLTLSRPVLVTLSGGADSVALLLVLHTLGYRVIAAHCNFHLRGDESNRDERWVRTLTSRLGVELHVKHFDVAEYRQSHKVSVEMACRELRYDWFYAIRGELQCQAIAVAHHGDDAIETFFINAMRGSGVQGLASIKPRNGWLVRPLLCVTRGDVEEYLHHCHVDYVVDSTNAETVYRRNKVRNVLLPELYNLFPESKSGLLRTLHDMRSSSALYAEMLSKCAESMACKTADGCKIDYDSLRRFENGEALLFELLKPYGFNGIQAREAWNALGSSGKCFYSDTHELITGRTGFEVCVKTEKDDKEYTMDLGADVNYPVRIAVERVPMPFVRSAVDGKHSVAFGVGITKASHVVLRHCRPGDRFRPFGMKGSKLLSDLFADAKLSEVEKRSVWVLVADGVIVWVLGLRAADAYRMTSGDEYYVKLTYKGE